MQRTTATLALVAAVLLSTGACQTPEPTVPGRVQLEQGAIDAAPTKVEGVVAYHGLPYAAPPVGALRWQPPQPATSWEGVMPGDVFGNRCIQTGPWPDMIWNSAKESEDCLYLSVWAPEDAEGLPVMLWIHGGGYASGSGGEARHDGSHLASNGVVLVTINYRLGVLGFLAHEGLTRESAQQASGNYGLMDMIASLRWVKDNIGSFGGDPGNVTIFGESAGSAAVSALMAAPGAAGLFHRAIGQSGAHFGNRTEGMMTLGDAEGRGQALASAAGASGIADLRAMTPAELYEKAGQAIGGFGPIVDGDVLPRSPQDVFSAGDQHDVPLLAGWTSAEAKWVMPDLAEFQANLRERFPSDYETAALYYPASTDAEARQAGVMMASDGFVVLPTWRWIEVQTSTGTSPVFRYLFDQVLATEEGPVPEDDPGAAHATDIPFVFNTMGYMGNPVAEGDQFVADLMATYWTNFARTGNPNGPGSPDWSAWGTGEINMVMRLNANAAQEPEHDRARFEFLAGR